MVININRLLRSPAHGAPTGQETPTRARRELAALPGSSTATPDGSRSPLPTRRDGGVRANETLAPRSGALARLLRTPRHTVAADTRPPASVEQQIDAWLERNAPSTRQVNTGITFHDGTRDTSEDALRNAARKIRNAATGNATKLELHEGFPATTLPEAIGRMQSLEHLSMVSTGLASLPESLGQLTRLEHLALASNTHLTNLPPSLTSLPALRSLAVTMTPLKEVPADIGKLQSLRSLTLGGGTYQRLPDSLTELRQLQQLHLGTSHQVTELPVHIGRMQGLESLAVTSHHKLERLPASLTQLQGLKELDLSSNRGLKALPEDLGQLRALKALSLRSCPALVRLPESVADLSNLRLLDLTRTGLRTLPAFLARLPANCEIRVSDELRDQLRQIRQPQTTQAARTAQPASPLRPSAGPRTAQAGPSLTRGAEFAKALRSVDPELAQHFERWMEGLQRNAAMFHQPLRAADTRLLDKVVAEALRSPGFRNSFDEFLLAHTPKRLDMETGQTQVGGFAIARGDVRSAYTHLLEHKLMRTADAGQARQMFEEALHDPDVRMSPDELLHSTNPLTGRAQMWPPLRAYVSMHDELGAAAQDAATTWAMAQFDEAQHGGIPEIEAKVEGEKAQAIANKQIEARAREFLHELGVPTSAVRNSRSRQRTPGAPLARNN